ncbi:GNAT family N-acetyltransferase [Maribacter algarum]|uniref:GNAT family N-acetyltransferase n=1 Tax=Maribacter algarum (ex Zhang et al. 2020) TaxID=2578118 RepID=A0A5S3PWP4_9FLAO|nr:GNAT family N-acetyltransferase [Maribacter algarum]TMM57428.1 GNAT family N-acetyltransferase [Maribacter algarum]
MNSDFKIELIPYEYMESILPLVFLLNNEKIRYEVLKERLKDMLSMGGYECIGVYDSEELIGICGIWVLNKLYAGKHVEPDNVFIKEEYRSRGVGQLMMDYMFKYAKEIGCKGSEVNCYMKNEKGQKFWERQGYKPKAYHYFMNFEDISNE